MLCCLLWFTSRQGMKIEWTWRDLKKQHLCLNTKHTKSRCEVRQVKASDFNHQKAIKKRKKFLEAEFTFKIANEDRFPLLHLLLRNLKTCVWTNNTPKKSDSDFKLSKYITNTEWWWQNQWWNEFNRLRIFIFIFFFAVIFLRRLSYEFLSPQFFFVAGFIILFKKSFV